VLIICLVSISIPTVMTAQSGSAPPLATIISQDGLNLRGGPSTSSPILATIPFASVVAITGAPTPDNWYPVSFGPTSGWALGDYLSAGEVNPLSAQSAPPLSAGAAPTTGPATPAAFAFGPAPIASVASPGGTYTATATYYGIDDGAVTGQLMACGAPFDPMNAGNVSTNDWPCGTHLRVTGPAGNSILVTVTDHGQYISHWLDLTYAGFAQLADHKLGSIQVSVSVVP
jgi:hypothetical protein